MLRREIRRPAPATSCRVAQILKRFEAGRQTTGDAVRQPRAGRGAPPRFAQRDGFRCNRRKPDSCESHWQMRSHARSDDDRRSASGVVDASSSPSKFARQHRTGDIAVRFPPGFGPL
jgi:hypothetical protein